MKVSPLQQNIYSPLVELINRTEFELPSSCRQRSKAVTLKVQLAVLLDPSVAVQVTVVVPSGKQLPDGGVQTTVGIGQLSVTTGGE